MRNTATLLLLAWMTGTTIAQEFAGLGSFRLPDGEWKLEQSQSDENTQVACTYLRKDQSTERITIMRFKKTKGIGEMNLGSSYAFCDMIADSLYEGVPASFERRPDGTSNDDYEYGSGFMIRIPRKQDREPLAVTNIYTENSGSNWMNHGLIASDSELVFLFVHSSTNIISPEVIQDVYFKHIVTIISA